LFIKPAAIDKTKIKQILIIHTNMAGDNVVATPMIRNIALGFKNAKITFLTREYAAQVLEGNPYISEFILYDKFYDERLRGSFKTWLKLIKLIRSKHFDLVIDTQESFTRLKRTLLSILSGARYRAGYWRSKGYRGILNTHEAIYKLNQHGAVRYLDMVTALGLEIKDTKFEVYFNETDLDYIKSMLLAGSSDNRTSLIGIHPGNLNKAKLWDIDKFAKIADSLADLYNAKIILTGSKDDFAYVTMISEKMKHKPLIYVKKTTFTQLNALITLMDLLITLDTVTVHIAAATNTPTIALYGQTFRSGWLPWNKEKQIVISKYNDCQECAFGDYRDLILPSGKNYECKKDYLCMKNIEAEEVLNSAKELLSKHKPQNLQLKLSLKK